MPHKSTEMQQIYMSGNIPPGLALGHILRGHTQVIDEVKWSPDGRMLASGSRDETIRIWDAQTGASLQTLTGHDSEVISVAWSPDGRMLASGSYDETIRIWDAQTGASLQTLTGYDGAVYSVEWSPDGWMLGSGSHDKTIRIWDAQTGASVRTLTGHDGAVYSVAWSPDGQLLASGSADRTIRIWNHNTGENTLILEGQTEAVNGLSFSHDGRFLASNSWGNIVTLWLTDDWKNVAILYERAEAAPYPHALAFHPSTHVLATTGKTFKEICIWDLDISVLSRTDSATSFVHYTSAKIALVGDSSVGKTALGYRVAEDRYQVTESTHGQQFWVVDKLGKTRIDGAQCETVLWDFAGQPNFRPIHALFLDDVDLALVLFDPSRHETLVSVEYWLKQLSHNRQLCRSVLVAARIDVSKLSITKTELEAFCRERNISGGFVATSAKTSEGIDTLLEAIRQQIDWNAKPTTITTETFKRIKDFVLTLKSDTNRKNVLVNPSRLRALLEATDSKWQFSDAEMITAVGHLQNHGYVTFLRRSSNEQSILLAPDVLINLAASFMLKAQSSEKGLGALEESAALRNEYKFPEVEKLSDEERDILLNAVTELFLARNICFRESIDNQTYLIFPSLILERPPQLIEETELVEDMTYIVTGPIENVYPTLVVLIGYSPSFQRINQWSKQAQYETSRGHICGFKQVSNDPRELEFVLYYGENTPDYIRTRFQGLFEEILYTRGVTVRKYAPIFCPKCKRQQERRTVIRRVEEGNLFLYCEHDGRKMPLPAMVERIALKPEDRAAVTYDQALGKMRTSYETALVRVKGFVRDHGYAVTPTCFVSYAWGDPVHEQWVLRLTDDLCKTDINAVLDQLNNAVIGANVPRFASRIEKSDFIIVVGTPSYRQKYENKLSQYGSMVAAEVDLINVRLTGTEEQKTSVLPILLAGEERISFPPLLHRRVYGDFRQEKGYFVSLFDLVLTIYRVPFDDPIVRDLRVKLREEAQALKLNH